VPWTVMLFGMANSNYDQHRGCKMTNAYDAANNFLGFYYTKLSFNVGYHVAHHLKPSLHWSRLPQCHYALSAEHRTQTIQRDPLRSLLCE
jgi:beta-carotene hydroxylase